MRRVLLLLLIGCTSDPPRVCPEGERCLSQETRQFFLTPGPATFDVLVVMDDSASMAGKQAEVLERLRVGLGGTLARFPGAVDVEMQFISSTKGGAPASCPLPREGLFRWNQTCGVGPNFEGEPGAAVTCGARFSPTGSGIEQPLAALEAHLTGGKMLRPQVPLFVVIITDEDDCSFVEAPFARDEALAAADAPELSRLCREADDAGALTSVSQYVSVINANRPAGTVVVSITGGPCAGSGLEAQPAPRLGRFAQAFPASTVTSFCEPDWLPAFRPVGERLAIRLGLPCLPERLVDADPAEPGVQPECVVTERPPGAPARTLPRCGAGATPCWNPAAAAICQSGQMLEIRREACVPPRGTQLEVACATQP
jgi:hypothetical protein